MFALRRPSSSILRHSLLCRRRYIAPPEKKLESDSILHKINRPSSPAEMEMHRRVASMVARAKSKNVVLPRESARAMLRSIELEARSDPQQFDGWLNSLGSSQLASFALEGQPGQFSRRAVVALGYFGVGIFSATGAVVGVSSDMNIIGCAVVGVVSGLGGGSIHDMLMGNTPTSWMKNPSYLAVALVASGIAFFCLPSLENRVAGSGSYSDFDNWMTGNTVSARMLRREVEDKEGGISLSNRELFDRCNTDGTGVLDTNDRRRIARCVIKYDPTLYAAESVGLSALALVAARQGILLGLHPFVSACGGVMLCFGGMARDVLCGQRIALGSSSYAATTFLGASVYVTLRQLTVHGLLKPRFGIQWHLFGVRMAVTMAAVCSARYAAYHQLPDDLVETITPPRSLSSWFNNRKT